MFWEINSYSESIDSLLSKEDVTLKELLDDEDILQDYKDQNKNLTQYLHRTEIIDELVTLITTEPPTDIADNIRFKYPNIACEILTSEVPALIERLVGSRSTLEKLYAFLEQDPPLNPLLTSFCSKTFGMLLSKKSDQDWFSYQCVCLQMLEFIKSRPGFLNTIYKHIGAPVIMDFLFQIITTIEGDELRNSLFEWLKEQQLVCNLIKMLGNEADASKHHNIAYFLSELIATGRSARQNELQKRGYVDSATDPSDPIINILEDDTTTNLLLDLILNNKMESSIVSGITIILKLLENPIINEPVSDTALQFLADAEKEHHKKIVAKIVKQIQPRLSELHDLLLNPPPKNDIKTTVTVLSPPFGITRLYICKLFSDLLETENSDITKAICETDFFNTLLDLFKQYCWNNILHNKVKKCFSHAFGTFDFNDDHTCTPSALQTHVLVNCKVASKLIDCWKNNEESQSQEKGRRLGYMGHLIDMFDSLNLLVLVSHQFRALVESNLTDDERAYWKLVTDPTNGYLVMALKAQKSYLGGIDPSQSYNCYETTMSKEFPEESYTGDYFNDTESNMQNTVDDLANEELFEATCSNRNLNTFDNDLTNDEAWSSSDIKYSFDPPIFSNNVFNNDLRENNIFSNKNYQQNNLNESSSVIPKNDTDWADFDSHFSDFQISDKNSFPLLEQNNSSTLNSNKIGTFSVSGGGGGDTTTANNHFPVRKTFAEVTAASTTWTDNNERNDKNANDIKRWASVVNDLGAIQSSEKLQSTNQINSLKTEQIDNSTENVKIEDITSAPEGVANKQPNSNANNDNTDQTSEATKSISNDTNVSASVSDDVKSSISQPAKSNPINST